MKKVILTLFTLILISVTNISNANSCSIKSGPIPELEEYIKEMRKVISESVSQAKSSEKENGLTNTLTRGLNAITSWSDYKTEFDFYLVEPIFNEVPYQITRDDKLLGNEIDNMEKLASRLATKGYFNAKVVNPCSATNITCNICSGSNCEVKAGELLIQLIDNTKKIRNTLQKTTVGQSDFKDSNLILTSDNLIPEVKKVYKTAKKECSNEEGGFMYQINERLEKISFNNMFANDGIEKWEEGWNLLVGTKDENYEKVQKELLVAELSRQGIHGNQAEQILDNLDRYNQNGGYSLQNNPISNSFNRIGKSINNQLNSFDSYISEKFGDTDSGDSVSISELTKGNKEVNNTDEIKLKIESLYKKQLPMAQMQDLDTTRIVGKIIQMHNSLGVSINELEKTIPISQKVCRDQASGKGKCEY